MHRLLVVAYAVGSMIVLADGPPPRPMLDLRVYDLASVPRDDLHQALDILRIVFQRAGVDLLLSEGEAESVEAHTVEWDRPGGASRESICRARRSIALRIVRVAPQGVSHGVLGFANPFASQGVNVTLFYDRIADAARWTLVPVGTLLANSAAHEIGHVLCRSGVHTSRGLMAEYWGHPEYRVMKETILLFEPAFATGIQATLLAGGCEDQSPAQTEP